MTLPRRLSVALHACAALLWLGAFSFYVRVWIQPNDRSGDLLRWATATVEGTSAAPYQYRILVPQAEVWLHRHLGWSAGFSEGVIDVAMLVVGIAALASLLRRLDLEVWTLAAACYGAALSIGLLWWGKAETITAFGATTVAVWAVVGDDRRRWGVLVVALVVLAGCRTDLVVAVGLGLLARWWWAGRRRDDLVGGGATVVFGIAATMALKAAYPDASYPVALIQVTHNAAPVVLATLLAFVAPALAPWVLMDREPSVRAALDHHRDVAVALLGLVVAELASMLVVGRVDEVRLLFPIAAPLAVLGIIGWRAALAPYVGAAPEA